MMTLSEETLMELRKRREAGERLSALAAEVGIPWQKLEKAIRHGMPGSRPPMPLTLALAPSGEAGPLTERYRPRTLESLVAQEPVVAFLRKLVANPHPVALLFEGETGTGKTSAALALATELGCATSQRELGGVHVIASGEQSAEAVRETVARLWNCPFYGSGWKVVIVNEADRMHVQAETIWLDRLENLPPRTVIVFTTNYPERLSPRFRDRCIRLRFTSEAAKVLPAARRMLNAIWKHQTGRVPRAEMVDQVLEQCVENGHLSFRRALACLEQKLAEGGVQ